MGAIGNNVRSTSYDPFAGFRFAARMAEMWMLAQLFDRGKNAMCQLARGAPGLFSAICSRDNEPVDK